MQINYYGKTSKLNIISENQKGKTVLKEVSFTAPFKVMQPFYPQGESGRMQVMALMASAGIMEGDRQEINIEVREKSEMEFLSQSYEKIHKMQEGHAVRNTNIKVGKEASFIYNPLPVIPFADSAFQSSTTVHLEDETSGLFMGEVISCGRYARGERFRYRYYRSLLQIYCRQKLIYMDNAFFEPSKIPMEEIGIMEGYSHLASIVMVNQKMPENYIETVREQILNIDQIEGGISRTESGDIVIRVLGNSAQILGTLIRKLFPRTMSQAQE